MNILLCTTNNYLIRCLEVIWSIRLDSQQHLNVWNYTKKSLLKNVPQFIELYLDEERKYR